MKNRLGRFELSRRSVENNFDAARAVMGRCVIMRCELLYANDVLSYVAASPDFDELAPGEEVPLYSAVITGGRVDFLRQDKT